MALPSFILAPGSNELENGPVQGIMKLPGKGREKVWFFPHCALGKARREELGGSMMPLHTGTQVF